MEISTFFIVSMLGVYAKDARFYDSFHIAVGAKCDNMKCGDLDLYLLSPSLRNHLSHMLWCLQTSPPASAVPSD